MRLLLFMTVTLLAISYGAAQEFHDSDRYQIILENFAQGKYENGFFINVFPKDGDTAFIRLLLSENNKEIFRLPLSHEEVNQYEYSKVELSREIPFSGIKEVVRLKVSYLACCSSEYSYYFLVTVQDKYIPLPRFKDVHCDGPEPHQAYKFTLTEVSSDEKIELVRSYPDRDYNIDSTKLLKTYHLQNGRLESVLQN